MNILAYLSFFPESVKWQLSEGKVDEVKLNIKKIASINGNDPIEEELLDYYLKEQMGKNSIKTPLQNVFKFPRFCMNFAFATVIWLLMSFSFFGGNGFAAMASDNPFMMLTFNAIIDTIACFAAEYVSRNRYLGRKWGTIGSCIGAGILYMLSGFLPGSYKISNLILLMAARLVATLAVNIQFLYTAEIFPTEIRGTATALKLSIGAFGGAIAPQILALHSIHKAIPLAAFGAAEFAAGACMLFLPESLGQSLPQTLIDAEVYGLPTDQKMKIRNSYKRNIPGSKLDQDLMEDSELWFENKSLSWTLFRISFCPTSQFCPIQECAKGWRSVGYGWLWKKLRFGKEWERERDVNHAVVSGQHDREDENSFIKREWFLPCTILLLLALPVTSSGQRRKSQPTIVIMVETIIIVIHRSRGFRDENRNGEEECYHSRWTKKDRKKFRFHVFWWRRRRNRMNIFSSFWLYFIQIHHWLNTGCCPFLSSECGGREIFHSLRLTESLSCFQMIACEEWETGIFGWRMNASMNDLSGWWRWGWCREKNVWDGEHQKEEDGRNLMEGIGDRRMVTNDFLSLDRRSRVSE